MATDVPALSVTVWVALVILGVLMARGATNQKGPQMAFLAAIKAIHASGRKLPVNIVLVAEGEEEIGSPNFGQIVEDPAVMAALQSPQMLAELGPCFGVAGVRRDWINVARTHELSPLRTALSPLQTWNCP